MDSMMWGAIMANNDAQHLKKLIDTLNDGIAFYEAAAMHCESVEHQNIFRRMASARGAAIHYLEPFLQEKAENVHAFGSVLQKMYPEMLAGLSSENDRDLVQKSREVEEVTHKAMYQALQGVQSETAKSVLIDVYPKINRECLNLDKAS